MTAYRYPNEQLILAFTLLVVLGVVSLMAAATVFLSLVIIFLVVELSYTSGRAHHRSLLGSAYQVTPKSAPELTALIQGCMARLRSKPAEVFVTRSRALNAYTFGLEDPKVLVLYSSLFDVMDADELRFIIGHELGHVALGHTWLNSLIGGMAGVPSPGVISAVLALAFLSWNRACELSADRAGLIACGKPEKAITALIKLVAGPQGLTSAGLERAYRQIDAQDDTWLGGLSEALATHPLLIHRIEELRKYAKSAQFRKLASAA